MYDTLSMRMTMDENLVKHFLIEISGFRKVY